MEMKIFCIIVDLTSQEEHLERTEGVYWWARNMGVEGNYYTSELSVRTSTEMNGKTVRCVSNLNAWVC